MSFRFKGDHLVVTGSEALPFVLAETPEYSPNGETLRKAAVQPMSLDAAEAWATKIEKPLRCARQRALRDRVAGRGGGA